MSESERITLLLLFHIRHFKYFYLAYVQVKPEQSLCRDREKLNGLVSRLQAASGLQRQRRTAFVYSGLCFVGDAVSLIQNSGL
jgi:hypothetical protein